MSALIIFSDEFTFHNVSINSELMHTKIQNELYLHSIMYLLIQDKDVHIW